MPPYGSPRASDVIPVALHRGARPLQSPVHRGRRSRLARERRRLLWQDRDFSTFSPELNVGDPSYFPSPLTGSFSANSVHFNGNSLRPEPRCRDTENRPISTFPRGVNLGDPSCRFPCSSKASFYRNSIHFCDNSRSPDSAHVNVEDIRVGRCGPNCVFSASRAPCPPKGDGNLGNVTLPPSRGHGQSIGPTTLGADISTRFRVFHLNVCGFDAHTHLIDTLLSLHDFPEFVAITETHLTFLLKQVQLTNYVLVSRRDQKESTNWGGVALFARADVSENIVLIKESSLIELAWHTLHSDIGPILLGVWYRRPNRGETASITQFDKEMEEFPEHVGKIIVGDMNVHNEQWLTFSNGSSPEGRELEQVCAAHGLKERVKKPTRGEHLLDLVLTDLAGHVRCKVVPGILDKDHSATIASVDIRIPSAQPCPRECFDIKKAQWKKLCKAFEAQDWASFFEGSGADNAANALTGLILATAKRFIPVKTTQDRPYKHPWIDKRCQDLLRAKHAAIGTPGFAAARDACTAGFIAAQANFVTSTRKELKEASPKDWWRTAKQLLGQGGGSENIPPLQADGEWAKQPQEKAALLAKTFFDKARLPPAESNEFTPIEPNPSSLSGFLRLRVRAVRKILKDLDETSGTGPDALPAIILRRCAGQLALPITLLARLSLREGRWPFCWRRHWVHPLHKRKSKADPRHYRGVHLTAQLSKVVERAVGSVFVPWMEKHCFGEHQYAYSSQKSHRDVLAVNVCSWLLLFEEGHAIGLYCSDVSGAFDRVACDRLCLKLRASGLPDNVVSFLESWLEDRVSNVVVSGAYSPDEILANSVFQGTVLGPPLWNLFYADAKCAVRRLGFIETVFADDFNCWKALKKDAKELDAVLEMSACQHSLHTWGRANQVVFDPVKESFALMRRTRALGENFKLLGITFDPQLLMHDGARKVATEAGWRLQAILRPRRFFSSPELVRLYKSLVLSYIESGTPGYYHASQSVLDCIDRVQRRFLREMQLSDEDALLNYRLAPLAARRDIAVLGFLHRASLGLVTEQIQQLFPRVGRREPVGSAIPSRVRGATAFHNRQLFDRVTASSTEQLKKSFFGMVQCYNALPQHVVNHQSVSSFQRELQDSMMRRAAEGFDGWQQIFSVGRRYASILRFQAFFKA